MLVEFGFGVAFGYAVEVAKEVELGGFFLLGLPGFGAGYEVIDEDFGVYPLLDVEGWCVDGEVLLQVHILQSRFLVFGVFAPPDELGVEVAVAAFVGYLDGAAGILIHDGLHLCGRDVGAFGLLVGVGGDFFVGGGGFLFGHGWAGLQ
ncbi:hypothetical protein QWY85_09700 [Neolewinella lacunae]|uniref:hypothetical protein n=1 Tax=Neolewinella lacunae TaxID=1517758 RepID=UPI001FE5A5B0|nr:hypothetical protein [Neolewinella lacunae]MDN3634932.1 hypothetical protein [Neolewinella lacunae]